ncbi:MAG: HNH endonuclease [Rhodothermaceae bacterium]|nr:HNH endonuclease [Rhodothermaceae bacterium]MYF41662.1 HNH endonuclease [Rhodothermaceae bacterium]
MQDRKLAIPANIHQVRIKSVNNGMQCALCKTQLTGMNTSKEHIFPNAIGGRRTVRGFICTHCNNNTGSKWDAKLARQLRPLCTLLGIKRPRGSNQSFTVRGIDGTKLEYLPDGSMSLAKPIYRVKESNGRVEINVMARTREELKGMIPGIVRRHPKLSQDMLLQTATWSKEPSPWFGSELEFGGVETGKSIIKTCLAMVYSCGLKIDQCEHAKSYLFEGGEPCFGYFNTRDLVRNKPSQSYFHCVWIRGDSRRGHIVAYVEYFGFRKVVACLSSTYSGKEFSCGYAIDPVTGKELDIDVEIDFTPDEIRRVYAYEMVDHHNTLQDLEPMFEYILELDYQRAKHNAIDTAIKHALSELRLPSPNLLRVEDIPRFSSLFVESFAEWVFRERKN